MAVYFTHCLQCVSAHLVNSLSADRFASQNEIKNLVLKAKGLCPSALPNLAADGSGVQDDATLCLHPFTRLGSLHDCQGAFAAYPQSLTLLPVFHDPLTVIPFTVTNAQYHHSLRAFADAPILGISSSPAVSQLPVFVIPFSRK